MITLAGVGSLIVCILYLLHFMEKGGVNKVTGCLLILVSIVFLGVAGFITIIMMIG